MSYLFNKLYFGLSDIMSVILSALICFTLLIGSLSCSFDDKSGETNYNDNNLNKVNQNRIVIDKFVLNQGSFDDLEFTIDQYYFKQVILNSDIFFATKDFILNAGTIVSDVSEVLKVHSFPSDDKAQDDVNGQDSGKLSINANKISGRFSFSTHGQDGGDRKKMISKFPQPPADKPKYYKHGGNLYCEGDMIHSTDAVTSSIGDDCKSSFCDYVGKAPHGGKGAAGYRRLKGTTGGSSNALSIKVVDSSELDLTVSNERGNGSLGGVGGLGGFGSKGSTCSVVCCVSGNDYSKTRGENGGVGERGEYGKRLGNICIDLGDGNETCY